MSEAFIAPIENENSPSPTASAEAVTKDSTAQAAAVQSNSQGNKSFSNMGQLKEISPELWKAMMEGIAMKICGEMQDHQKRLKEMMQKAREDERA
jgi:hypothetical protein